MWLSGALACLVAYEKEEYRFMKIFADFLKIEIDNEMLEI
jgi:hypothetical protein